MSRPNRQRPFRGAVVQALSARHAAAVCADMFDLAEPVALVLTHMHRLVDRTARIHINHCLPPQSQGGQPIGLSVRICYDLIVSDLA